MGVRALATYRGRGLLVDGGTLNVYGLATRWPLSPRQRHEARYGLEKARLDLQHVPLERNLERRKARI
jgi:hypothetical protein